MRGNRLSFTAIVAGALILVGKVAMAQTADAEDLIQLAKKHFGYESIPDEEKNAFDTFFRQTQEGEKVDVTPERDRANDRDWKILTDPAYADSWDKDRIVKADWLVWICTDPQASAKVTAKGIEIVGARIDGMLDLAYAKISFPIRTSKCAFKEDIVLDRSVVRSLELQHTQIKCLQGDGLTVEGDVLLSDGFQALGRVSLQDATIGRTLDCDNGRFINPGGQALNLEGAKTGAVYLRNGFRAEGVVWLFGATITGNLECDNGRFINPGGQALNLEGARIGGVYLWKGFRAEGVVWLFGANINGNLDCDSGQFINPHDQALSLEDAKTGAVLLRNVRAEGGVRLFGATITGNLECDNGRFINPGGQALNLEGARIGGVYLRKGFRAEGVVWLFGANITGNLDCDNGQFINPGGQALSLEDAKTGAVLLRNVRAEGGVRLFGATITGNLECDNGKFINPHDQALNLEGARTGAVYLRNCFRAEGEVWLRNAIVAGDLDCDNGHFINPGKLAIKAELANVQGSVRLVNGFGADGGVSFQEARIDHEFSLTDAIWHENASLNLTAAKVKTLLNQVKGCTKLKNHLFLHGLTFDELGADADLTAKGQIEWINLQPPVPFRSQPYEQMAKVFRDMGLQEEAVNVMIAKNEDAGRLSQGPWNWFWYHVFGKFIRYGYYPWSALLASFFIVALGTFFFKLGYENEIIIPTSDNAYRVGARGRQRLKGTYPKFNALIYSLETFVPLVKLAVEQYWIPSANRGGRVGKLALTSGSLLRCYLWFHIIAGWILTTLWVGGFTGLLKT